MHHSAHSGIESSLSSLISCLRKNSPQANAPKKMRKFKACNTVDSILGVGRKIAIVEANSQEYSGLQ